MCVGSKTTWIQAPAFVSINHTHTVLVVVRCCARSKESRCFARRLVHSFPARSQNQQFENERIMQHLDLSVMSWWHVPLHIAPRYSQDYSVCSEFHLDLDIAYIFDYIIYIRLYIQHIWVVRDSPLVKRRYNSTWKFSFQKFT